MTIAIMGADTFGCQLATALQRRGKRVFLLEQEEQRIAVAREHNLEAVRYQWTHPKALEQVGLRQAQALVACTDDDRTNLRLCQIARAYFGIKLLAACTTDDVMAAVFDQIAIQPILPSTPLVQIIERLVGY